MLYLTIGAVVLGLAIGFARRGSLEQLAQLPIRVPWLVFMAWLIEVVLFVSPLAPALDRYAVLLYALAMALTLLAIVANRKIPGVALLGLGLLLNAAALASNGGFMPVSDTALAAVGKPDQAEALRRNGREQKSTLMQPETPAWFLGDVIPVAPLGKVYSVGDFVAGAGVLVLVVGGMGSAPRGLRRRPSRVI